MQQMNLIDTHCHLDFETFADDLDDIIKRAQAAGVEKMITISTRMNKFSNLLNITNIYDCVSCSVGVHPCEVEEGGIIDIEGLLLHVDHPKVVGIGETGLDFYYNNSDREKQISSFKEHIEASIETKSPLIVHSRNAEKETYEMLNSYKNNDLKILMHCFTGSKEFSKKLLLLDSYFSASGIITFKNSLDLQDTFKSLPLEKMLIETDSPFLAPTPNRGKKNEPSFIDFTAAKLAEIKEISKSKLVEITTNNFNKLFFN